MATLDSQRRCGLQPKNSTISATTLATARTKIRFDRNELAGAFGDMGTDLPLLSNAAAHPTNGREASFAS